MVDYPPATGTLDMSWFWTFWIIGIIAGIIAGRMGRRAWAWLLYGALTGPIALFHILMLAAIQIRREERATRAAGDAADIAQAAPVLTDGLAHGVVADIETAPGAFERRGMIARRVLAGLDGRPAYLDGTAWPDGRPLCLRLDRMAQLADADSGAVIPNPVAWAGQIRPNAPDAGPAAPSTAPANPPRPLPAPGGGTMSHEKVIASLVLAGVAGLAIYLHARTPPIEAASAPPSPLESVAPPAKPAPRADVAEIQRRLARLGYDPGPADGFLGAKTRAAIAEFQRREREPATGAVTPDLLHQLRAREILGPSPARVAY